ncbi:MAG: histidine kinase dimerization/phosphoacceptor domain-containing protein [Acidimicrobiales bacterium]
MRLSRQPVQWLQAHPVLADALLAAFLGALGIGFTIYAEVAPGQRTPDALAWVLIVAMNAPVAVRRTIAAAAMWAVVLTTLPFWILDYPDPATGPSLLVVLYSLGAHLDRPRSLHHFWAGFAVLMSVLLAGVISTNDDVPWLSLPANGAIMATAWILGDNLRTRRAYLLELEDKAAMTESQRRAEAERAVAEERTRIARELHDVVAHSMSVMVVQASAARRVIDADPVAAAEALTAIETTRDASRSRRCAVSSGSCGERTTRWRWRRRRDSTTSAG